MTLAEKILSYRKQAGLSQEELAERIGVSRQAVSRWEMGSVTPDAANLLQLSSLFHVTIDDLLRDDAAIAAHREPVAGVEPHAVVGQKPLAAIVKALSLSLSITLLWAVLLFSLTAELPALLLPISALPLPVLCLTLLRTERSPKRLLLLVCPAWLVVVNAIALVGFFLSYRFHYGEQVMHLILWDNVVCYVNAAAFLSLGIFLPLAATPKKWYFDLLLYLFCCALVSAIACALYGVITDSAPAAVWLLSVAGVLCIGGCVAYAVLKHRSTGR